MEIINEAKIRWEKKEGQKKHNLDYILKKSFDGKGLSSLETSILFQNLDSSKIDGAMKIAAELKKKSKGNVASLYTCLYITNECYNDCGYCGFRASNLNLRRLTLTKDEISNEIDAIKKTGVTNIILIGGTKPEKEYKDLILHGTKKIKQSFLNPWVEFENLSPETFKELKELGANHFVLFQETYDSLKYMRAHKKGPLKKDYFKRLEGFDTAFDSGMENIGLGSLFGLTKSNVFEVLGLYHHAKYFQNKGANISISIPTLQPAPSLSISPQRVSEDEVKKIYTTLRLALPNVSLILSGRENQELRNCLFPLVDQIGSGGTPNPGGRTIYKDLYKNGDTQFEIADKRSPLEITKYLNSNGIKVKKEVNWN